MSCDCDYPAVYHAKIVRVRKSHKCCECNQKIACSQQAEKVDALWDGSFQTIYTCLECMKVRDRIKQVFSDDDNCLCCHGEMFYYLWHSDLLWDEDEIEEEARNWVPNYDDSLGVIKGANHVIGTKVDWLRWYNGKLCLVEELSNEKAIV